MQNVARLQSDDGQTVIEIIRDDDGTFIFNKYIKQYDPEEETYYEMRVRPNPGGRYANHDIAIKEAQAILNLV